MKMTKQQGLKSKDIYTESAGQILRFRNLIRKELMTKETWKLGRYVI